MRLKGKTAIVVGAGQSPGEGMGNGRATVLRFVQEGARVLAVDRDLASAEALEEGLRLFEGTVIAVTHDRWFTRSFDRFVLFGSDSEVVETSEPVWDVR